MAKTTLIIGGQGGIGTEVTRACVARGDKVIATVMDETQKAQLAADVPGVTQIVPLLLDNAEAVLDELGRILAKVRRLDQVVVCAAIAPIGPTELIPLALCRKTIEINTISNVAIFQATVGKLRASKGRILFITSMSGKISLPFIGAYTASKHAMEGLADVMRQEVAPQGVKVIIVEPGGVRTPMVRHQIDQVTREIAALSPEVDERYGHLYRGFQRAASAGYETAGSSPAQIAEVIMTALNARKPQARYIAGDDAKHLVGQRRKLNDAKMDAMLTGFFSG